MENIIVLLSTVITACLCCEWCSQFWFSSASQRRYGTGRVTRYRLASVWGTAEQTESIQPWEETTGEQGMNKDLKKAIGRLTEMLFLSFPILKKYQVKLAKQSSVRQDTAFSQSLQRFRKQSNVWRKIFCVVKFRRSTFCLGTSVKYMLENERMFLESITVCSVRCIHYQRFLETVN